MWSGSRSAEPTAKSLLAGPAEDLTPWWELDSRLAEFQRARPRRTTSAVASRCVDVGSRCVDGRWVLEGPAPAWFRGAQDLLQGTPLAPADAFEVTRMLAAGDADDLEQGSARFRRARRAPPAPAYAVEEDPAACLEDVSDDADVPLGGRVASRAPCGERPSNSSSRGATQWYRGSSHVYGAGGAPRTGRLRLHELRIRRPCRPLPAPAADRRPPRAAAEARARGGEDDDDRC